MEKAKDANIVGILVGTLGVGVCFSALLKSFVSTNTKECLL